MTNHKAKLLEALTTATDSEAKEILTLNKISLGINNILVTDENIVALKEMAIKHLNRAKAPRGAWAKREDKYSNFISYIELDAILAGTHDVWLDAHPAYITPVEGV